MNLKADSAFYLAQFSEIAEQSKSTLHLGLDTLELMFEGYSQGIVQNLHPSRQQEAQELMDYVWLQFTQKRGWIISS